TTCPDHRVHTPICPRASRRGCWLVVVSRRSVGGGGSGGGVIALGVGVVGLCVLLRARSAWGGVLGLWGSGLCRCSEPWRPRDPVVNTAEQCGISPTEPGNFLA